MTWKPGQRDTKLYHATVTALRRRMPCRSQAKGETTQNCTVPASEARTKATLQWRLPCTSEARMKGRITVPACNSSAGKVALQVRSHDQNVRNCTVSAFRVSAGKKIISCGSITTTKETHDCTVPASAGKIALQLLSQDEGSYEGEIVLRL